MVKLMSCTDPSDQEVVDPESLITKTTIVQGGKETVILYDPIKAAYQISSANMVSIWIPDDVFDLLYNRAWDQLNSGKP